MRLVNELAQPPAAPIETDALIIGAGPAGLFQVFQLGLLDIKAHVVDALPYPGGQCIETYPDKPIYDIPGIVACTGRELVDRLVKQMAPFGAELHLSQEVSALEQQADGRFAVETSRGTRFLAKTIFVAAGVGAFQPKRLRVDGIEAFEDSTLFYRPGDDFMAKSAGKKVLVIGGDDGAVGSAVKLAETVIAGESQCPTSVTLMHRRDVFQGEGSSVARMRELVAAGSLRLVIGQPAGFEAPAGVLTGLQVTDPEGIVNTVAADVLLVQLGVSPRLGPVADWGLALERKQVVVDTEKFATSTPGIFAVGDINTYPGKKKLILSSFHECALAAFGAAEVVFPDRKALLQYTTTSPRLHQMLGVPTPSKSGA
ncbi:MAG: NAD(P)/FAD-dependent oxidoreductase [Comamonadaceae bacterium]|nr:MAG: NAD(P)/FAD-dependent oxidoreductase [Comamonadaceae bacterium]